MKAALGVEGRGAVSWLAIRGGISCSSQICFSATI